MKKILIFSTAYLPFIGGAEIAVKEISDRIKDVQFDMITARLDRKLPKFKKIGRISVYRIGAGFPKADKYYLAFWGCKIAQKMHEKNNYDAVWAIMASYGGFAAMYFKKKNTQVPFLLTLQEGDDPEYIRRRVWFLKHKFKQIFTSADKIICISNYLAKWARNNGAKCEVEIIPNGVNLSKFKIKSLKFKTEKFREKIGFKPDDKIVITTSRLVKKNGVDNLIKAMGKIVNSGKLTIKLLIIGDGEDRGNLEKLTKELKIKDRVLFLGEKKHDELPKYLWNSNIFCRPSLSEGLGNSFLEAMAAGVPIIGTKAGGIPDFLKGGETGLFCEVNSPESIAGKIMEYINNPERADKIAENARKLVEERYNWDNIAKQYKNIFVKINEKNI